MDKKNEEILRLRKENDFLRFERSLLLNLIDKMSQQRDELFRKRLKDIENGTDMIDETAIKDLLKLFE